MQRCQLSQEASEAFELLVLCSLCLLFCPNLVLLRFISYPFFLSFCLSVFLSFFLPSFLPSFAPSFLPSLPPSFLPSLLPSFPPFCLSVCLSVCLSFFPLLYSFNQPQSFSAHPYWTPGQHIKTQPLKKPGRHLGMGRSTSSRVHHVANNYRWYNMINQGMLVP